MGLLLIFLLAYIALLAVVWPCPSYSVGHFLTCESLQLFSMLYLLLCTEQYVRFVLENAARNKNNLKHMKDLVDGMIRMQYGFEMECGDPSSPPGGQGTLYMWGSNVSNGFPSLIGVFRPRVTNSAEVASNLMDSLISGN